jgi:hypothetical protein
MLPLGRGGSPPYTEKYACCTGIFQGVEAQACSRAMAMNVPAERGVPAGRDRYTVTVFDALG